ncbi:MAG: 50S ribosomal protein L5 [Candidatus Curtissbacteria bacterium]|nr:50S ribosomal protein L5 [Candidatus Curtissbacteria bacterium]
MPNLQEKYQKEIMPALKEELKVKNSLAVPRLEKVVLNISLKEAAHDEGVLNHAGEDLAAISGQKAQICRAKKSIAAFKLVKGNPIGVRVTLRGSRMYSFLDKLFNIVLPRVRDFRGTAKSGFDGQGNYTLGVSEQIVFPEIDYTRVDKIRGLEVTFVTNTKDDKSAKSLLERLGMPFAKPDLAQGKPSFKIKEER